MMLRDDVTAIPRHVCTRYACTRHVCTRYACTRYACTRHVCTLSAILLLMLWPGIWQTAQAATRRAWTRHAACGSGTGGSPVNRGKINIRLEEHPQAAGETILLGEIAHLQGAYEDADKDADKNGDRGSGGSGGSGGSNKSDDEALIEKLNRIPLGKSPRPGRDLIITRQTVLYNLKKHLPGKSGFDPGKFSFSGPDQCLVGRQYQEIGAEEIESLFRGRFFERFPEKEFELEKVNVHLPQKIKIPDGKIEYEISLKEPPVRKEETFALQVKQNGDLVKQIWISASFRYHTTILTAARDLERGQVIAPGDVLPKPVVLNNLNKEQIQDPALLVGLVCRQQVREGRELTMKMVEQPLLVKKGAIIKMTAENKHLRIVGLGKARADGRRGETIPAENLTSGGNVYGVVTDENQILVTF